MLFASACRLYAAERLTPEDMRPVVEVDAVLDCAI